MKKKNKKKASASSKKSNAIDNTAAKPSNSLQTYPEFPALGHQLIVDKPRGSKNASAEGWICVHPSRSQRMRQFGMAYVQAFVLAFIALACLYLPDFVLDYSHRESNFLHFFAGFFFAAVCLVAVCAAINTLIRDTVCHIHPESGRLVCKRRLSPQNINDCIDLHTVPVLELLPPGTFFRRTRIITMHNNMEITIIDTGGKDDDVQALYNWMREIRAQTPSDVTDQT